MENHIHNFLKLSHKKGLLILGELPVAGAKLNRSAPEGGLRMRSGQLIDFSS